MTATLRQVSDEQRRALLVERQLLGPTDRQRRSVVDVLDAIGLIHSTDPATPYLSLHARTDVTVDGIDAALYDSDQRPVRQTSIRRTVFLMDREIASLACGAYNPMLVARLRKQLATWIDARDPVEHGDGHRGERGDAILDRASDAVVARLRSEGPRTGTQLAHDIADLRITVEPNPNASTPGTIRITSKVLEILAAEGRIVRGRPAGQSFTSGAWTWVAMQDWWPDGIRAVEPAIALGGLLERHLAAFGPATITDLAWWTGLAKGKVRAALELIDATEVLLDGDEHGWIRRDDSISTSAATPTVERAACDTVALLPALDCTTMGWKQRVWYVDDTPASGLFDRSGNAGPTVWVDGRVVGAWTQLSSGEVVVDVADMGSEVGSAIDAQADRVATWLGDVRVKWRFPTPRTRHLTA